MTEEFMVEKLLNNPTISSDDLKKYSQITKKPQKTRNDIAKQFNESQERTNKEYGWELLKTAGTILSISASIYTGASIGMALAAGAGVGTTGLTATTAALAREGAAAGTRSYVASLGMAASSSKQIDSAIKISNIISAGSSAVTAGSTAATAASYITPFVTGAFGLYSLSQNNILLSLIHI